MIPHKTKKPFFPLGFTLIELIVVITILAILGTLGFIAMKNYGATARDSVRISDIQNNLKALAILQIKTTTFPIPESAIEIKSGTRVLISYQGYLGADISRSIGMNTLSLDPKDKSRYTYAIDASQKKSQLLAYLESGENVKVMSYLNPVDYVFAADSLDRHIYVAGDMVGILTSGADQSPLQSSTTATGINLSTIDTSSYVAYFGGDAFGAGKSTGTGDVLINQLLGAATNTIPCNPVFYNGYNITSLAHHETKSFSKPVTVSNGSGTGSLSVTCTNGVLDTATAPENTVVSCTSGFVNTGNNLCTANLCGGSIPLHATMFSGSTQSVSTNWTFGAGAGVCTFACDAHYTWNGSDTCVADTQIAPACNGSIISNAHNTSTGTSWTQTWDGNAWNPVYTYARNATAGICTYDCNVGYSWDQTNSICTLNHYTVSGSFGNNAANQSISVCGSSVIADTNGNFTLSLPYGSVCNTISASRSGYTCTTSTNGPASLTGNVSDITGSCSANACVAGTYTNNGHTYSVPEIPSGNTTGVTSAAVQVTNGTQTFSATYGCTAGTVNPPTSETANTVVCNSHYTLNAGSCVADTRTFTCAANPSNTTWNTVSSYLQTWNGTAWLPADTSPTHNLTSSTSSCNYKCNAGYFWNNTACTAASAGNYVATSGQTTQPPCTTGQYQDLPGQIGFKNCTNKPANSSYTASSELTSNTCPWTCAAGYASDGVSCVPNSCLAIKTAHPENVTDGTYTIDPDGN